MSLCVLYTALKGERDRSCKMLFTPPTDSSHDDKHILWSIVYKSAKREADKGQEGKKGAGCIEGEE